ncbi:MAG: flavoprotein [Nannocystaceae bacterium]
MRRAPVIRAYDVGDTTVLVADDGTAHELAGASALLARAVLAFTCAPRSRAEILAHVESLTGGPLDDAAVVDQLLELLRSLRVLIPAAAPSRSARGVDGGRPRVLLGITGAIASAWTPGLIALLQGRGFEVRVVATEAALRFVQPRVIEALVHHPVLCSLWAGDAAKPAPHLELARWADAVLVCPASATTLARLAAGDHSTLLSAAVLSTRAPVLVAPSMNDAMYAEAAVQRNLAQLVADGVHVAHAGSGREVADAPAQRVAALGSAPPHAAVASLLEAALRIDRARRRRVGPPRDADEWDALYRSCADEELAWHTTALDDDLAAALGREAPGRPRARPRRRPRRGRARGRSARLQGRRHRHLGGGARPRRGARRRRGDRLDPRRHQRQPPAREVRADRRSRLPPPAAAGAARGLRGGGRAPDGPRRRARHQGAHARRGRSRPDAPLHRRGAPRAPRRRV